MGLQDLLSQRGVIPSLQARCKREVLSALAEEAARLTGLEADLIKDALMEREQLGSTGLGNGVAIPHGKIVGLTEMTGIFAKLDHPVDFDSVDNEPVDLVFLLLAPAGATAAHLKALAKVSRLLRDEKARAALRGAETQEAIYAIASEATHSNAA